MSLRQPAITQPVLQTSASRILKLVPFLMGVFLATIVLLLRFVPAKKSVSA